MSEKAKESRLRRQLAKMGYILRKSRIRNWHGDNFGGYMIIEARYNGIIAGSRFQLSLDDVEQFVNA